MKKNQDLKKKNITISKYKTSYLNPFSIVKGIGSTLKTLRIYNKSKNSLKIKDENENSNLIAIEETNDFLILVGVNSEIASDIIITLCIRYFFIL